MPEALRRPTKRAQHLRNHATDCEQILWYQLRQRRLSGFKFSRQIPIGRFICDFVCRRAKLVVELDGGQHADKLVADEWRTRALECAGYRVIRFWNNEVTGNLDGVLERISEALTACPPPDPLPVGEGGKE